MTPTTMKPDVQAPLVPANVSFPGYTYIPLDIKLITESDLAFLDGDGFKAAITLLAKSWQETPATSLPCDDRMLANLAGFGKGPAALAAWNQVKDDALSDFVLCTDGRLYSRSLATRALEAWDATLARKAKTANGRAKIAEMRAKEKAEKEAKEGRASVTDSVTDRKEDNPRLDDITSDEVEGDGVRPDPAYDTDECPF